MLVLPSVLILSLLSTWSAKEARNFCVSTKCLGGND